MDEKMKELDALFDFFREIDKEKLIERKTYVTGRCAGRTMRSMPGTWR